MESIKQPNGLRKEYVLDTNILINDPLAIYNFEEHNIVIPMTVLEELDHLKDTRDPRRDVVSRDARMAVHQLDGAIGTHSHDEIEKGVSLGEGRGTIRVFNEYKLNKDNLVLPAGVKDNMIIAAALHLQATTDAQTIFVTKDLNARLKSLSAGMKLAEDYHNDQVLDDIAQLSAGYVRVDEEFSVGFSNVESVREAGRNCLRVAIGELPDEVIEDLFINLYLFNSEQVWRVTEIEGEYVTLAIKSMAQLMNVSVFGIKPRNELQALAFEALMDPEVTLVSLAGPAGSGKTLVALAAALEQGRMEKGRYDKIMVTRNTPPLAEDIGFLPGDESEKMGPWLEAFEDSLEVLVKTDTAGHPEDKLHGSEAWESTVRMIKEKSNLQFKAMTFMRGRSLQDTFVILDESQNMTAHHMKTAITRIGKGSKLVCTGNLAQIDLKYGNAVSSGLATAIEGMKAFEGSASVILPGGERSPLAAFAEENL